MEGFEKGSSPSKSTGENNENLDSNQDKMNPKFQGRTKMAAKHFMSPTISASSKAAAPRKKILAERNESSSPFDTQSQKRFNLDMKKSPRNSSISPSSRIVSSYNHGSKPNDDGDSNFVASPVKAYDPSKNYLSPRPKYLRFNPNRRLQILNRLEKEGRDFSLDSKELVSDEEESSVEEIKDSSFSPSKESVMKNDENSESEHEDENTSDEYEEEEKDDEVEERGWCVRGVLKLVLMLLACLLSTSYICSLNSPTPSPAQEAVWSLRDGYFMVKNQTLEVISTKMHDSSFLEVEDDYGEYKEVEIDVGGIKGENEESYEEEMEEKVNGDSKDKIDEVGEGHGEYEEVEIDVDDNNGENKERVEESYEEEMEEKVNGDSKDKIDEVGEGHGEYEEVEIDVDDNNGENKERVEGEMYENDNKDSKDEIHEAAEEVESEIGGESAEKDELSVDSSNPGLNKDNVNKIEFVETEVVGGSEVESKGVNTVESLQELSGSHEKPNHLGHKVDEMGYENLVETGSKYSTGFGVIFVVVSLTLASLAIVRHLSKRSRNVKPDKFSVKEKKVTPLLPSTQRKIEFFAKPSLPNTVGEASRKINHHLCAPNVELIGEIDFSLRNSAKRHHMNQSEEKNASFSTTSLDSYGSFTTQTKILKKEGGQSKEAMIDVTPVRRSSRLRNRAAVTSP